MLELIVNEIDEVIESKGCSISEAIKIIEREKDDGTN
jgi:hypothetical protein